MIPLANVEYVEHKIHEIVSQIRYHLWSHTFHSAASWCNGESVGRLGAQDRTHRGT
jgi:hypothetical protein